MEKSDFEKEQAKLWRQVYVQAFVRGMNTNCCVNEANIAVAKFLENFEEVEDVEG